MSRIKVIKHVDDDAKELAEMFEQMTGAREADVEVIIPKTAQVLKVVAKYCGVLQTMIRAMEEIPPEALDGIKAFHAGLTALLAEQPDRLKTCELDDEGNQILVFQMRQQAPDQFYANLYKDLSGSPLLKQIIITSNELSPHRICLERGDDSFIRRESAGLVPLAFSNLDIAVLWFSGFPAVGCKFVMSALRHLFNYGLELHKIFVSPNINIKKFSMLLVDKIAKLRKRIPRCDDAFDIIEKSVRLLEDKFNGYYRGAIEADNPTFIIESFLIDVSTTQNASPQITAQFKKIAEHMQSMSASMGGNPRANKLFNLLNQQFDALDKEI